MRSAMVAIGALLIATWLAVVLAYQWHGRAQTRLDGAWIAERSERDGQAAADVIGHRLSIAGERFEIHAKDGSLLFTGTIKVDAAAKPATIDFVHGAGALGGRIWKGIYEIADDKLTVCDNAADIDRPRPSVFAAPVQSGYVLIDFVRVKDPP